MKKLLLLCTLFMCITTSSIAQEINQEPAQDRKEYVYCQIVGMSKFLSPKISIVIDLGHTSGQIADESGKSKSFRSMVDAMNWFAKDGWEVDQTYAMSAGSQMVYHWLLKIDADKKDVVLELEKQLKGYK